MRWAALLIAATAPAAVPEGLQHSDLPALNAALNAASGVLLSLGYLAIRGRRVRTHITLMVTALVVSTVFLASYLYYHIVVRGGYSTPFTGQGWVRPVYYTILISHVVLAAVITPVALYTAYLGWRNRPRHVWVARWTLPIWLYVSVTGVVVYWMLYRLFPGPTSPLQ